MDSAQGMKSEWQATLRRRFLDRNNDNHNGRL